MSTSRRWVAGAVLFGIAGGFAAATAYSTPPELVTAIEPSLAADLAAGDLRAQLAAVQARASTIAQMPRLAAAVATDAETVRDLTSDELAFDVRSDETIELGQLRGASATSLLRRPEKAGALRLAPSGPSIAIERSPAIEGAPSRTGNATDRSPAVEGAPSGPGNATERSPAVEGAPSGPGNATERSPAIEGAPPSGPSNATDRSPAVEGARPGGERIVVTHVVTIVPPQDADLVRGSLAVARAVEPALALPQLAKRTAAIVFVGDASVTLGDFDATTYVDADVDVPGVRVAGATDVEVPGVRVRIPGELVPPPSVRELYAAAAGAGVVMVLCLVLAVARRRRPASEPAVVGPPAPAPVAWSPPEPAWAPAPSEPPPPLLRVPSGSSSMPTPRGTAGMSVARRGRYEPLDLLGEGGTSSVFLARSIGEAGFERRVALKVLRPELALHPEARELFLDEARLASRIDHPNVVQILDLGLDGDEYYIAMEHVDGDDLESILQRLRKEGRAAPIDIALAIARRVCDGLHAAHTAVDVHGQPLALVHRDVKPGNVLVSRNGQVKVGDFGIAKATQQLHVSAFGVTRGTVQFMAPEQRLGGSVDPRTDVFGAGALIYELMTCAELDLDTRRLLAYGVEGWPHLAPMRQLRPELPPELEAIVARALAFDAAGRHDSCAELEAELAVVVEAHDWAVTDRELGTWLTGELDPVRRHVSRRMVGLEGPPT